MAYDYITSTGTIVPDTTEILSEVQNEFRMIFGQDFSLDPRTPQGILVTAQAVARTGTIRNNALVANQINPNLAAGIFLDAIGALTATTRYLSTPTLVQGVVLTGVPGTVVPGGAQASLGQAGEIFRLISSVTLVKGKGTGAFQAVNGGPIQVAVGALDTIVHPVEGWETVSNPYAGDAGNAVETDGAYRTRRRQQLALQGVSLSEAVISHLRAIEGVRNVGFRENTTNMQITIDGVTLKPHSIYACVEGGMDTDVAFQLWKSKTAGAGYNGNQTVPVTDPFSGQVYQVQFDRPDLVQIWVDITVRSNSVYDLQSIVVDNIVDWANGRQSNESGLLLGGGVYQPEIAKGAQASPFEITVLDCKISKDGENFGYDPIPMNINQRGDIQPANIKVTLV